MIALTERLVSWTKCFFAIRRLSIQSSPEDLVDFCLSQPLAPLQIRSELLSLANEIAGLRARNSMEIGTANGGTLFLLCRLADSDARIVSVDQYRGQLGGARKMVYYSFLRGRQCLHIITGDSHSEATLAKISRHLGPEKLDFLFIDGDHSYNGAKLDFEMYSPLVHAGGVIAFHDIVAHPPEAQCHVKEFWDEVKRHYRHREIIDSPLQQWGGIGVLYV